MTARDTTSLPFSFEEFTSWYEAYSRASLEPARQTLCRILGDLTLRIEAEYGAGRFRVPQSRIKDPVRLWTKMNSPRYVGKIKAVAAIPDVIDDLVGVRVVCTNKSDVRKLQAELDSRLVKLDWNQDSHQFGVAFETESERDYLTTPKESGYRAYHANLVAEVPGIGGSSNVRGELQVRTLLQEGWGELTHEDTYKPGQEVPPFVDVLSRRMGELLGTVDDIAEDIQKELARASRLEAGLPPDDAEEEQPGEKRPASVSPEIVRAETQRIVDDLQQPTSLATIASRLRSTFGQDNVAGWLGHPSFKAFLLDAVPGIRIVQVGPSYVVPAAIEPDESWPQSLRDALRQDDSEG